MAFGRQIIHCNGGYYTQQLGYFNQVKVVNLCWCFLTNRPTDLAAGIQRNHQ